MVAAVAPSGVASIAVVPAPASAPPTSTRSLRWLLPRVVVAAKTLWGYTEIGHHGQYSLERLYALDEYCRSMSRARVAVVCCATPLAPLLLVLALELIPLQAPSRGWQANYALSIRAFFSAFVVAHSVSMQARNILPGVALSHAKCAAVATPTAVGYVAVLLLLAWLWVFPVPFSVALCSAPFTGFFMLFGVMAIGRAPLRSNAMLWPRLRQFVAIMCIQVGLTLVYPAYNAVFIRLSMYAQAGFVLLLPALKTTVKYVLAQHVVHIEDYLPEIAVVSVEVFHALYLSTSMQNTGNSPLVTLVIVTFDATHLVIAFRRVHGRTKAFHRRLESCSHRVTADSSGLVACVLQLCEVMAATPTDAHPFHRLRLRSCVQHSLSPAARDSLERLASLHAGTEKQYESSLVLVKRFFASSRSSVVPETLVSAQPALNPPVRDGSDRAERLPPSLTPDDAEVLSQTLQLLFTCEYLVLSEYIECVAPAFYLLYLGAVHQLPNAKYYPQIHGMSADKLHATLGFLALYASLELLSLAALHVLLQRKFRLPPLRLLAFVLETQREMIVGKLVAWALIVLQLPLVHFGERPTDHLITTGLLANARSLCLAGLDFSFQFAWTRRSE